jgi:hypothetical protein
MSHGEPLWKVNLDRVISAISNAISAENNKTQVRDVSSDWDKFMLETCGSEVLAQLNSITIVPEPKDGQGIIAHLIKCETPEGDTIVSMPDVVVVGTRNWAGISASLRDDLWNEIKRMDIVKSTINSQFANTQRGANLADKESKATFMASTYMVSRTPDICKNIHDIKKCKSVIGAFGDGLAALINEADHPGFLKTGISATSAQPISPYADRCDIAIGVEQVASETHSTLLFPAGLSPSKALGCNP